MQLEPNLFYDNGKINARGVHDAEAKCLILKSGSSGILCTNPRNKYFESPNIKKIYEAELLSNISSAGDDTHYYLTKDIRCYPTDKYDELSVAASLMAGCLVTGEKVWKYEDGVSVRKRRSKVTPQQVLETEECIGRYEDATKKTFEIISKNRSTLIDILSLASHTKNELGTKPENRFVVPSQVDHCLATFGFLCEEAEGYDLRVPAPHDYTISDKMGNDLFHQETSKKTRTKSIKNLPMSNTHSGQDGEKHRRPRFDCLMVMQYSPFLVCGVTPYHKIVSHFKHSTGGWTLNKVPVDYFKYIISPTEKVIPRNYTDDVYERINEFSKLSRGGLFLNILDKLPKIEDNVPLEIWK